MAKAFSVAPRIINCCGWLKPKEKTAMPKNICSQRAKKYVLLRLPGFFFNRWVFSEMILLVESSMPNWVDKSISPVRPKKAEPIMGKVF